MTDGQKPKRVKLLGEKKAEELWATLSGQIGSWGDTLRAMMIATLLMNGISITLLLIALIRGVRL